MTVTTIGFGALPHSPSKLPPAMIDLQKYILVRELVFHAG